MCIYMCIHPQARSDLDILDLEVQSMCGDSDAQVYIYIFVYTCHSMYM